MDKDSTKLEVLGRWLDFVSGFIRLKTARLVTLGGRGLEAGLWQKRGVPAKNGWVVERGIVARKKFIADLPYHYCNTLKALPTVLGSVYKNGYADAVHLDLCGTLEPQFDDFLSIMRQVILDEAGARCFAVTVADQRQNPVLENFGKAMKEAGSLFGIDFVNGLFETLVRQQEQVPCFNGTPSLCLFDPRNGAKRELGIMSTILGALMGRNGRVRFALERIERFVYVSRMSGHPFRMRTYFIHFAQLQRSQKKERTLPSSAKRWQLSPLTYLAEGTEVSVAVKDTIPQPVQKKEKTMETSTSKYPKLAALAAMIGGDTEAEFKTLVAQADSGAQHSQIVGQIAALVGKNGASAPAVAVPVAATKKAKLAKKIKVLAPTPVVEKITAIEAAFRLLKAEAKGKQEFQVAKLEVLRALGWNRLRNRNKKLGALIARMRGGHRGDFVYRATNGMTGKSRTRLIADLAGLYSKIGKTEVTPAMLESEVKEALVVIGNHVRSMNQKRHT